MTHKTTALIGVILLMATAWAHSSTGNTHASIDDQRDTFLAAEKSIQQGNYTQFEEYKADLKDYPLLPYLEYTYLTKRLSHVSDEQIEHFVTLNSDTPLAGRLRYLWLKRLARNNNSEALIKHFQPTTDTALECAYRSALLKHNLKEQALQDIQQLWLVGHSQPPACDAVFKAWKDTNAITDDLRWKRIELAMDNKQLKLASFLARSLPKADRREFTLWSSVYRQPHLIDDITRFSQSNPRHIKILAQGIQRLAFRDIDHAIQSWNTLQDTFSFHDDHKRAINQTLALLVGQTHHDKALDHLSAVDPQLENQRVREWRVRAALRDNDWPTVLATIAWLTEEEQMDTRWQYWRARALEELGLEEEAREVFASIATQRNFHAFLAADRLGLPYSFDNSPADISAQQLDTIALVPGMRRAKELLELGRTIEARREWEHTSDRLDNEQLLAAAKLAQSWQWHSSAIFTAARISYWDDIPLRFPLGYQNDVIYQANKFDIEPAWVYGIMRQESAFVTDARSGKGALGLMQLLPSTGKYIAKKNKTPFSNKYDLLIADKNINLGSAYLRNVRSRLYDHPVLATAAYNAGYARVKRWLPDEHNMAADIWIETIPYDETRDYLERVLSYTAIYDWRLNEEHQNTLVKFMKPVGRPGAIATQTNNGQTVGRSDPS